MDVSPPSKGGVIIKVGGVEVDLKKAPKDINGNIALFEIRADNRVWIDGKMYFDPIAKIYFA